MIHLPVSGIDMAWWPLVWIGFTVGVVGGYFGIGAAWLVTPGLNIFGFPMIYAVGTDMTHIVGKSIVATFRHWRFGHVSAVIALIMLLGTFSGVEAGAQLLRYLTEKGMAGTVVRVIYMIILAFLFFYMLFDYLRARRIEIRTGKTVGDVVGTGISKWLHEATAFLPPIVRCRNTGMTMSAWFIVFIALVTGFIAGILGIGGGLVRVPAMIYLMGLPTKVAVGTDLFEVMFSGAYGCFTYSVKGGVELVAAVLMLLGAAVGAQFGTICTKYVYGIFIRLLFSITCLFAFVAVLLKQLGRGYERLYEKGIQAVLLKAGYTKAQLSGLMLKQDVMQYYMVEVAKRPDWFEAWKVNMVYTKVGTAFVLGAATLLTVVILFQLVQGVIRERRAKLAPEAHARAGATR
jgi:uncharacterized membrane protein YfcA